MSRYSILIALVACILCSGCPRSTKKDIGVPPPPIKARIEALIDSALQLREAKAENVPYVLFKEAVLVSIDIWETYAICVVDREELVKLGAIDLAEAQGKINAESARADANARIAWYVAGGGVVLSIITFLVGAFAL